MVFGPATNLTQKAVEVLATMLAPANESPDHIDARVKTSAHRLHRWKPAQS